MKKTRLGPTTNLLPLPAFLVGARDTNGRPNFATIAWGGVVNSAPPMVAVALRKSRHTRMLIEHAGVFSVNVPSSKQAVETDYCGIVSGRTEDKVSKCGFTVFYGVLEEAPLIEQCPIGMECRVRRVVELPSHDLLIGEVVETHVDSDLAIDMKKEFTKADPLVFMGTHYARVEGNLGRAFSIGGKLR